MFILFYLFIFFFLSLKSDEAELQKRADFICPSSQDFLFYSLPIH